MKKYLSFLLSAVLTIGSFSAYTYGDSGSDEETDKIQIVATIFPEYDWVMNILVLNSMQSTTAEDVRIGAAYLSIMESNLSVLKDALK